MMEDERREKRLEETRCQAAAETHRDVSVPLKIIKFHHFLPFGDASTKPYTRVPHLFEIMFVVGRLNRKGYRRF